jgi:hypothetical protein
MVADRWKLQVQNRAHSGATVLYGSGPDDPITDPAYLSSVDPVSGVESATGEVPRSKPTILEQAASFDGNPDSVSIILVDGGINDVSINNIVNPLYPIEALDQSIEQHCHREMTTLLKYVVARFPHPACKVVVTGYFPILSNDSSIEMIPLLLMALRLPPLPIASWRKGNSPIELALEFWHKSDRVLAQSVQEVKDPRVMFVRSGFAEQNALFAPDPLLREPSFDLLHHPEYPVDDNVYDARGVECQNYPQDPEGCLLCPMASLGHPTEGGAKKYAKAILAKL